MLSGSSALSALIHTVNLTLFLLDIASKSSIKSAKLSKSSGTI